MITLVRLISTAKLEADRYKKKTKFEIKMLETKNKTV